MYNFNILFKITGSIAAYKSAIVISRLVQAGCNVKVVMSESALNFIGAATFEGITGNKVFTNSFAENEMMSHISLVKWADVTIIAPATANTINKLANGIADSLLTSLFLAHDREKPYLIAPAMNTKMYTHPATQDSLNKLKDWGVDILPTEKGYLACGDIGEGKLIDTEIIFNKIISAAGSRNRNGIKRKVLVTYGGTSEDIDGVRSITNLSTGKTGAFISEQISMSGHQVSVLRSDNSTTPKFKVEEYLYRSFSDYKTALHSLLNSRHFDYVIHLAALSDYSPSEIQTDHSNLMLPLKTKLPADSDQIRILFTKNEKVISSLKNVSMNKNIKIIGFKLTNSSSKNNREDSVKRLFKDSYADFIVHNDINDRVNDEQKNFTIYGEHSIISVCKDVTELSEEIEKLMKEE